MAGILTVSNEIESECHVSSEMKNNSAHIKGGDDANLFKTDGKNLLITSIDGMLKKLQPQSVECCIYRVPQRLRKVNEEAYTPQIVSIGPFHHGKKHLQAMEEVKMRHLQKFLGRSLHDLEFFVQTVITWEQKVRDSYSETFKLSRDEFVTMILVDGCFIVELLMGTQIIDKDWMRSHVIIDMMLLENQLPFFVLNGLFNVVFQENPTYLLEQAHYYFSRYSRTNKLPDHISSLEVKHFVDFLHQCHQYSIPEKLPQAQQQPKGNAHCEYLCSVIKRFVDLLRLGYIWLFPEGQQIDELFAYPPNVRKLREAGIVFKKVTSDISLFGINFSNGILEIPQLIIDDWTGTIFRNLTAFEMCQETSNPIITHYLSLLDSMITTSKDVDPLIEDGIIENAICSSKEVSALFNHISTEVIVNPSHFYFKDLCQELNAHCKSPWYRWKASLRHDYFSNPWAIMSVIAAVVLLVLTFIQTMCSILAL